MSLPQFTADASVHKPAGHYATVRTAIVAARRPSLVPQQAPLGMPAVGVWTLPCELRCVVQYMQCLLRGPSGCDRHCRTVCNVPEWSEIQRYLCQGACQGTCERSAQPIHAAGCRAEYQDCLAAC